MTLGSSVPDIIALSHGPLECVHSSRTRGMKKPMKLHTYLAKTTDLDLVWLLLTDR